MRCEHFVKPEIQVIVGKLIDERREMDCLPVTNP
jgi:hypothetical protein